MSKLDKHVSVIHERNSDNDFPDLTRACQSKYLIQITAAISEFKWWKNCTLTPNHKQTLSVGGILALTYTLSANWNWVDIASGLS